MGWITLAGTVVLAAATTVDNLPMEPAQLPEPQIAVAAEAGEIDTVEMDAERYQRMTVPVTIMGEGPFNFLVDTGAQATVLSTELANHLQLHDRESAMLVGMASIRAVETTMVPEFGIGARTLTIRTAPLLAGANIGGADGILGLDSLQDQRVLLDFQHNIMSITDAATEPRLRGYEIVVRARERLGQLIIHRAEIDGVDVALIIDTGAQGSIGNMELGERLRRRQQFDDSVMTDVNGVQITGQTRLVRRLRMGDVQVNSMVLTFAESPTFARLGLADEPAMILGMSELQLFDRVAIDFKSQRVAFDLPSGVPINRAFESGDYPTRTSR